MSELSQFSAVMSKREFKEAEEAHEGRYFNSRFDFLMRHNGLRPGQCHFLLGTAGCGKSSLARAIQIDCARGNRVQVHLSEEKIQDAKYKLNKQLNDKSILENIFMVSENQRENYFKKSLGSFFEWFEDNLALIAPDVVFFDNLTTSTLWTSFGLQGQEEALIRMNNLAEDTGKTFFFVIHTKKDITDATVKSLIQPEDCRGTQQTALLAPYFYVFQNFKNEFGNNATIRVAKSRFHDQALNKFYAMNYSSERGTYTSDKEISFNDLRELFQHRYRFTESK